MYKENLDKKIAESMKDGNKLSTDVWRSIKNEFTMFEKNNPGKSLDDAQEMKILSKMAASRKESYEIYSSAKRNDLAENEKAEYDFIEKLLPDEPTAEDIKIAVETLVSKIEKPSMKDMKAISSEVKKQYPTADGGVIFNIFKSLLNN